MSAETLRRAAALMRENAEAATPGPWSAEAVGSEGFHVFAPDGSRAPMRGRARPAACTWQDWEQSEADAEHIASWHPNVALPVADLLDHAAARAESKIEHGGKVGPVWSHERDALAVARAYLGEDA